MPSKKILFQPYKSLHRRWTNMKQRCYNPKAVGFVYYGQKGITVCKEWLNDFEAFAEWALQSGYSKELNLDRIDKTKEFSPTNCRFTTPKIQNVSNKCTNKYASIRGITLTISEWADLLKMPMSTMYSRLYRGHTDDIILSNKSLIKSKKVKCLDTNKCYASVRAAAIDTKIGASSIYKVCCGKQQQAGKLRFMYID